METKEKYIEALQSLENAKMFLLEGDGNESSIPVLEIEKAIDIISSLMYTDIRC